MNNPSHHEFDDELLSAYLDDELSADERACVESRLAADPDARQTLEHLRNVSQSVRELPTENVPRDLRDAILNRAAATTAARPESAKGVVPSPQPPAPNSQLPTVSIGPTTRSWVWAAAAIAAAVLIMVLQPRDERNDDLPNLAKNNRSSSATSNPAKRQLGETELQGRLAQQDSVPAPTAAEPMPSAAPASTPQNLSATGQASVATAPAAESATMTDQLGAAPAASPLRDEVAQQAPAAGAPVAEELSAGDTPVPSPQPPAPTQPVVVRVLAKRSAVDSKAFDALLRKHNVDVDPSDDRSETEGRMAFRGNSLETAAPVEAPPADSPAKSESETVATEGRSSVAAPTQRGSHERDDVELVLVDAPVSTIYSCMNDLNTDAQNFTSISVDDAGHASKTLSTVNATEAKRSSELARFSRGTVPQSQDALSDADYYLYWGDDRAKRGPQPQSFAKSRDLGRAEKLGGYASGDDTKSDRGRARRLQQHAMQSPEARNRSTNTKELAAASSPDTKDKAQLAEQFGVSVAPAQDRMQVLFVIQPSDEPAPSLKAKNQAQ